MGCMPLSRDVNHCRYILNLMAVHGFPPFGFHYSRMGKVTFHYSCGLSALVLILPLLRPFIKDDEVKYYLNIKFYFVLIFAPEM